jgi:type IV secretory pathway VirB10-like protein
MRLTTVEIVVVGVLIVYLAFFSNPPPAFVQSLLETPVGKIVALLAVLYVTVYQSLIMGVFLAVAFIMSASKTTEYLDNPKKKEEAKQPSSNMDSMAEAKDIIKSMMKKGDKLPSAQGKSVTAPPPAHNKPKPATPTPPKGKSGIEKFASF